MELNNLFLGFLKIRRACQIFSIVFSTLWEEMMLRSVFGPMIRRRKMRAQKEVYSTQERLRITIEELGPTYIKFGQILADRPDVVSERFMAELKKLQSQAQPFDNEVAIKIIEEEMRHPMDAIFSHFDTHCLASASIGQVYQATLLDGTDVIIKVRRPNVEQKIKLDLYLMRFLAEKFAKKYPEMAALNIVAVVDEFGESILKELDYYNEASNMIRFGEMFRNSETVKIPHVYMEYTTKRVIVQERIYGITPDNPQILREAGLDTNIIARNGADALLTMILRNGFFHADPHAGNMFIMPGNVIGLIDFGMVGVLRPRDMDFLANITIGFLRRNEIAIADALISLCNVRFFDKRDDLIFSLQQMVKGYEHIPIKKLDFSKLIQECLKIITKYGLTIPGSIFMLAKALATIQKLSENLDPNIPFAEMITPYAKDILATKFSPKKIANQFYDVIKSYGSLIKTFPDDISEILYKLKQGEIRHDIRVSDIENFNKTVRNFGFRLAYSILLVGVFIGAIMLLQFNPFLQYPHFLIWISSILIFMMIIKWLLKRK